MNTELKLKKTRGHWESTGVESLKDKNLRHLEIQRIVIALQKHIGSNRTRRLADFGCGDGYDTIKFSSAACETVGFDYSEEMLSRASSRSTPVVSFRHLDLISDEISESFSAAVSKRFLINLGDWDLQSQSLTKISRALEVGSIFCLLECFHDGLSELNRCRQELGLSNLSEPFHNAYLDLSRTLKSVEKYFEILEISDFSTYYFLTRCVSERLTGSDPYQFDQAMREIAESSDLLGGQGIGPQKLICLRKR